jgi:hypothetical protein
MASPVPYRDDDPRPRGSARLHGNVAELGGTPTARLRHRKPSEWSVRQIHQKLVIAACHEARLPAKIVAEFLGISAYHVRRIYRQKASADRRRNK